MTMTRSCIAVVSLALTALVVCAQDPKKDDLSKFPQVQRPLLGDDAKKAVELQKQIVDAEKASKRAEALKRAEELLVLRTRVQGAEHWETRDVKFLVAE